MTNMPEAKLAREAEICYATVAMVTDFDCWHPDHDAVTVQDIIKVLTANAEKAKRLVARLASDFPREHEQCPIGSDRALDTALDHRAGGARSGADQEARRGGGQGARPRMSVGNCADNVSSSSSWPGLSRPSTSLCTLLDEVRRGCPAQGRA